MLESALLCGLEYMWGSVKGAEDKRRATGHIQKTSEKDKAGKEAGGIQESFRNGSAL